MRRNPGMGVCFGLILLYASIASGDPGASEFPSRSFLVKRCAHCHNSRDGKPATARIDIDELLSDRPFEENAKKWSFVLQSMRARRMPPSSEGISPAELASVEEWISKSLSDRRLAAEQPEPAVPEGSPGRVTARRLNRAEYDNTVRDLLGVKARAEELFPVDDSGYGFNNNGDALSVSPLLMEKLVRSAKALSRQAVYGADLPPKPRRLVRLMSRNKPSGSGADPSVGAELVGYSIQGSLNANYEFPVEAQYEFRVNTSDFRTRVKNSAGEWVTVHSDKQDVLTLDQLKARSQRSLNIFKPVDWVLTLDGEEVKRGSRTGGFYEFDGKDEAVFRLRVKAGTHSLRVYFPSLAEDVKEPDKNLIREQDWRELNVRWVDISGPYGPIVAPERNPMVFVCGSKTASCAKEIVENLAFRAYRRPPADQEVGELMRIFNKASQLGRPFDEGVRAVVETVLLSPQFLFRTEGGSSRALASAGAHPVTDWELASRLSYFLWSSMPDGDLFRAAREGTLHTPSVLAVQVKRMLADPKSSALGENFGDQWLGLTELKRRPPDPDRFPTVDDELRDAMMTETHLFFRAMLQEDRSILDFIDARFTFLNGPLARLYGISGVNGIEFRRVELEGDRRGGLLTQASVLSATSYPTRTSVTLRGKWVLSTLMGSSPPPPPANVPVLKDAEIGKSISMRQSVEEHRKNPACASCHVPMDSIGLGLENYDATGAWRDRDGKISIDSDGKLPDGTSFSGANDLKKLLKSRADAFRKVMAEKILTYALGRGLESYDRGAIDGIVRDTRSDQDHFSALILSVVTSKPFLMRDEAVK